MRNLVAEDHQEFEEEVAEHLVFLHVPRLDVNEHEFQEVEHVQRRACLLANILNFLQVRKYDLNNIDINPGPGRALLSDQLEQTPYLFEQAKHISGPH